MSEINPTPDPIPIRPRLHRQSPSVRELRTKKTRTNVSRNVPPRLLTKIQDMWSMDLREPLGMSIEPAGSDSLSLLVRILAKDIVQAKAALTSPSERFTFESRVHFVPSLLLSSTTTVTDIMSRPVTTGNQPSMPPLVHGSLGGLLV